jgi:hypothetical protein
VPPGPKAGQRPKKFWALFCFIWVSGGPWRGPKPTPPGVVPGLACSLGQKCAWVEPPPPGLVRKTACSELLKALRHLFSGGGGTIMMARSREANSHWLTFFLACVISLICESRGPQGKGVRLVGWARALSSGCYFMELESAFTHKP